LRWSRIASPTTGDDQHIAGFEPANDLRQLRAVAAGARGLLLEHLGAAGGRQLIELQGQVLIPGADPSVSVGHEYCPRLLYHGGNVCRDEPLRLHDEA
jgi:hypothetical protein